MNCLIGTSVWKKLPVEIWVVVQEWCLKGLRNFDYDLGLKYGLLSEKFFEFSLAVVSRRGNDMYVLMFGDLWLDSIFLEKRLGQWVKLGHFLLPAFNQNLILFDQKHLHEEQ